MKKFLALLILTFVTAFSFGQTNYSDVVYLKDGSVIRGVITEQVPNQHLVINSVDGNILRYTYDQIEKLAREPIKTTKQNSSTDSGLQTGYKGILEMGYQFGIGQHGLDRLKLDIINGYQFNPYFSVGIGTGLRYYFDLDATYIPVFADFRVHITSDKIAPYLALGVGYTLSPKKHFEGEGVGFLINPSLGINFKVSQRSSLFLGIGYEMQKMNFQYSGTNGFGFASENSRAISAQLGISF